MKIGAHLGINRSRLLLPAGANQWTLASQLDDPTWLKVGLTVTPDYATAPDSTVTADQLVSSSTTSNRFSRAASYTQNLPFGVAFNAKAGSKSCIQAGFPAAAVGGQTGGKFANFDVLNGLIGTVSDGVIATIKAMPNGFYRCTAVVIPAGTISDSVYFTLLDDAQAIYVAASTAGDIVVHDVGYYTSVASQA